MYVWRGVYRWVWVPTENWRGYWIHQSCCMLPHLGAGNGSQVAVRMVSALNHWAIFPTPLNYAKLNKQKIDFCKIRIILENLFIIFEELEILVKKVQFNSSKILLVNRKQSTQIPEVEVQDNLILIPKQATLVPGILVHWYKVWF